MPHLDNSGSMDQKAEVFWSETPWSEFSDSDYTVEQLLNAVSDSIAKFARDKAKSEDRDVTKADLGLRFKEPNGKINRNGVQAALQRLPQTEKFPKTVLDDTQKQLRNILDKINKVIEENKKSLKKQRISDSELSDFIEKFSGQDNELERILFNPTIFAASLVDMGANEFPVSIVKMKSKNTEIFQKQITQITNVTKQKNGNVELDGLLITANRTDAHGDLFLPQDIKIASDRFMAEGRTPLVDIQHDEIFGKAFISEIFIVKDNDPTFDKDGSGEFVGSLAARIQVTDSGIKEKVLRGELQGLSVFGEAEAQLIKKSIQNKSILKKLSIGFEKLMADVFKINLEKQEGELTMAEVQDILDAITGLSDKIDKLVKPADNTNETQKSEETIDIEKNLETAIAEKETLEKAKTDLETQNIELKEKVDTLEKGLNDAKEDFKKMEKEVRDFGKNNGQDETTDNKNIYVPVGSWAKEIQE